MPRADSIPVEDAILATKQTEPTLSAAELAARVGCSVDRVERTLESRDEIGLEPPEPTDWSDPDRCPFCGEPIADDGPGCVEHVESADDCAVAFARWREGVAGDVEGERVA